LIVRFGKDEFIKNNPTYNNVIKLADASIGVSRSNTLIELASMNPSINGILKLVELQKAII